MAKDKILEQIADAYNTTYEDVKAIFDEVKKGRKKPAAIAATYGKLRKKQIAGEKLDGTDAICVNIGSAFIKRAVKTNFDCDMLDVGDKHPDVSSGATWIRTFVFLVKQEDGSMIPITAMRFDAGVVDNDIPLRTAIKLKGTIRNDMLSNFSVVHTGDKVSVDEIGKHVNVVKVCDVDGFIQEVGINKMDRTEESALITGYVLSPIPGEGGTSDRVELMSPEDPGAPSITVWTDLGMNDGLVEYTEAAVYGNITVKESEKYGQQLSMNSERLIYDADEELVDALEDVETPDIDDLDE